MPAHIFFHCPAILARCPSVYPCGKRLRSITSIINHIRASNCMEHISASSVFPKANIVLLDRFRPIFVHRQALTLGPYIILFRNFDTHFPFNRLLPNLVIRRMCISPEDELASRYHFCLALRLSLPQHLSLGLRCTYKFSNGRGRPIAEGYLLANSNDTPISALFTNGEGLFKTIPESIILEGDFVINC